MLTSKYFLNQLSLLRNYNLKSVADIMLQTSHIVHVRFFFYSDCWRYLFIYLFITNSELDSDNYLLNTKLLFIDLANVNGKK